MKVILLQNVPNLGQKGDIKEVNKGYAQNLLIPRKLAEFASKNVANQILQQKQGQRLRSESIQKKAEELVKKVSDQKFIIKEKANEKGHLFARVHLKEIADAIGAKQINISEDWIKLEKPIKEVGEFNVPVEAYGFRGSAKIIVEAL